MEPHNKYIVVQTALSELGARHAHLLATFEETDREFATLQTQHANLTQLQERLQARLIATEKLLSDAQLQLRECQRLIASKDTELGHLRSMLSSVREDLRAKEIALASVLSSRSLRLARKLRAGLGSLKRS